MRKNIAFFFAFILLVTQLLSPTCLYSQPVTTSSSIKEISPYTKINKVSDLKKILESATYHLQTELTLLVPSENLDTYSRIINELTGITRYRLSLSKIYSFNILVISLEYKQAYKLTQALHNPIAYKKLTQNDLSVLHIAQSIASQLVSPNMSDYEKERAVHDYIVRTTSYDYNKLSKGTLSDHSYTAAGVLLHHSAVCEGYSEATKLLLNLMDIECEIVTGKTKENVPHAWNIVRIDNEWYMLDTTFDDPISYDSNGKRYETLSYDYFNVTSAELMKDRTWDTSKWPTATHTTYNYYVYSHKVFHNYSDFKSYIVHEIQEGSREISCYLTHYDSSYDLSFIFNHYKGEIKYFAPTDSSGSLKIILS